MPSGSVVDLLQPIHIKHRHSDWFVHACGDESDGKILLTMTQAEDGARWVAITSGPESLFQLGEADAPFVRDTQGNRLAAHNPGNAIY